MIRPTSGPQRDWSTGEKVVVVGVERVESAPRPGARGARWVVAQMEGETETTRAQVATAATARTHAPRSESAGRTEDEGRSAAGARAVHPFRASCAGSASLCPRFAPRVQWSGMGSLEARYPR
jgi:hypothetical protein